MQQELTIKQQLFCKEYIIDFNATRAAKEAGYSEDTAAQIGYENLIKPYIQEYIKSLTQKTFEKLDISVERVLKEYERVGFSRMTDFASWNATNITVRNSEELTEDQGAAVSKVTFKETKEGIQIVVETHDKLSALDKISRYLGMYKDVGSKDNPMEQKVTIDTSKLSLEELLILRKSTKNASIES